MIMWEIGSRRAPYEDVIPSVIKPLVSSGKRETDLNKCPQGYMELIKQCWAQDPQQRPTVDKILLELQKVKQKIQDTR